VVPRKPSGFIRGTKVSILLTEKLLFSHIMKLQNIYVVL